MTTHIRRLALSPTVIAAAAALLLVGSIVVNRVLRHAILPGELEFVPSENALLLATGDIESLWTGVEDHFGPAIRDTQREGPLRVMLAGARDMLDESEVPVATPADLRAHGIDTDRGVLISVGGLTPGAEGLAMNGAHLLAVVPVLDGARARGFVEKVLEAGAVRVPDADLAGYDVVSIGDEDGRLFAGTPRDTLLVVATSLDTLRRSLSNRSENRRTFLEDDALYDGVSQLLGRPLLSGPTAVIFWRPPGTPIRHIVLSADLRTRDIALNADIGLVNGTLRVIDRFRQRTAVTGEWASWLPATTLAAIALQEERLTDYLQLAASVPSLRSRMQSLLAGLLYELRRARELSRIVIAVTGYHDGVPDVLAGVWADPAEMSSTIGTLRVRLRRDRDLALLRAAAALQPQATTASGLIESGALQPEANAAWSAYRRESGEWRAPGDDAYSFERGIYTTSYEGIEIEYMTPPLGENDVRLREGFETADPEVLRSGRYRLSAAEIDGVTWFALDTRVLAAMIDARQGRARRLPENPLFDTTAQAWSGTDKVQMFLNVEELAATAALDHAEELDPTRNLLLDFQQQPSIAAAVRPAGARDAMRLLWTMTRIRPVR